MGAKVPDLPKLDVALLPQATVVTPGGGSRTFGNTVISWSPSATEMAVTITVTMGGGIIAKKKMTPEDNQMVYNGVSGQDWSKGIINASFGPTGMTGQINGDLKWYQGGTNGNYTGFIGDWGEDS